MKKKLISVTVFNKICKYHLQTKDYLQLWYSTYRNVEILLLNYLSNYNHFHNILRLLDVLPNFPFTTSETMDDYYL